MNYRLSALILSLSACVATAARADDSGSYVPTPANEGYQPPRGEQPEYGKKFYPNSPLGNPDERQGNMLFEINPAIILKRGVGIEFERRFEERLTLGADFLFTSYKNEKGNVKSDSLYVGVAPKVRLYPIETLSGVFFGFKLYTGLVKWSIETGTGSDKASVDKSSLMLAPSAHLGYRFVSWGKFTFAFYGGGGVNLPLPNFEEGLTDKDRAAIKTADEAGNWDRAVKDLKDEYSFRPDFGLTMGLVF